MNNPYIWAFLIIFFLIFKSGSGFNSGSLNNQNNENSGQSNHSIISPATKTPSVLPDFNTDTVNLKKIESITIISIASVLFFIGFHTGLKNGTR